MWDFAFFQQHIMIFPIPPAKPISGLFLTKRGDAESAHMKGGDF